MKSPWLLASELSFFDTGISCWPSPPLPASRAPRPLGKQWVFSLLIELGIKFLDFLGKKQRPLSDLAWVWCGPRRGNTLVSFAYGPLLASQGHGPRLCQ